MLGSETKGTLAAARETGIGLLKDGLLKDGLSNFPAFHSADKEGRKAGDGLGKSDSFDCVRPGLGVGLGSGVSSGVGLGTKEGDRLAI